jgi:hypothetical protein
MRNRTVELPCDAGVAHGLGRAIRAYAHAAYPPGGSECAQVAREALLDVARQCDAHHSGSLALRKRTLPQLRAAVRWWLSTADPSDVESRPDLEELLMTDNESA